MGGEKVGLGEGLRKLAGGVGRLEDQVSYRK